MEAIRLGLIDQTLHCLFTSLIYKQLHTDGPQVDRHPHSDPCRLTALSNIHHAHLASRNLLRGQLVNLNATAAGPLGFP